jgi:tetratricopeptide (TPR) repeat protein
MRLWAIRLSVLYILGQHDTMDLELKKLGDLNASKLKYDKYPHFWPPDTGRSGSMVTFEVRLLACLVPSLKGNHKECIEKLYQLLYNCRKYSIKYKDGSSSPLKSEEYRSSISDTWTQREVLVKVQIVNQLIKNNDTELAIAMLETLIYYSHIQSFEINSIIGRLHLAMGDYRTASHYFDSVESEIGNNPDGHQSHLLLTNKALIAMGKGDYDTALARFERLGSIAPSPVVQSNSSLVKLYLGFAIESVKSMESLVQEYPMLVGRSIDALFNLSTLYDLLDKSQDRKKQLLKQVVSKHSGDDFKIECLKL